MVGTEELLAPSQSLLVEGGGSIADDNAEDLVLVELRDEGVALHQQLVVVLVQRLDLFMSNL